MMQRECRLLYLNRHSKNMDVTVGDNYNPFPCRSFIMPVHNGGQWLEGCLLSVVSQTFEGRLELSVYNDGSKDETLDILKKWKYKLEDRGITVIISGHEDQVPRGVGFAKNRAVNQSKGRCLCFLDADDVMHPDRISRQYSASCVHPSAIVGCKFHREPPDSTKRFTEWANSLSPMQLYTQVYTSHGPTVIMPTWCCMRQVYDRVGGFDEGGKDSLVLDNKSFILRRELAPHSLTIYTVVYSLNWSSMDFCKGVPEDLIFFYRHLELGGQIVRVDQDLLMYRYHPHATTFSIEEDTIWAVRVAFIQRQVLDSYTYFSIWSVGKQGKRFFRSLSPANQAKVQMFCDVDEKKIKKQFYTYEESKQRPKPQIPIVHFSQVKPPVIICVKMNLTGGSFEENLSSLNLVEGEDYFHFN